MSDETDPTAASPHLPPSDGPEDRVLELPEAEDPAARKRANVMGWAVTIAVAIVLTVLVKSFILQAYSIPSPSMVPTLLVGDRVVVFRLNTDPARGDIVVFDRPANDPKTSPDDPDVLIKRVIGLPGDKVESRDGVVYVNDEKLVEQYLPKGTVTQIDEAITVPDGQLLVLGDNRTQSFDSRYFGTIDKKLVVGRAVARIWPPSRLGGL